MMKYDVIIGAGPAGISAGVYAAGDIRVKQVRQISTAVADGTIAAINTAI